MQNRNKTKLSFSEAQIDLLLSYFPNGVCCFDLEMTGLSPLFDHIIEIAAVKITPDREIESFHRLVNPLIPLPERTKDYHGISNEQLRSEPTIKYAIRDFSQFFENLPLIAHNAIFDCGFIVKAMQSFQIPLSYSDIYDSCKLSRLLYKKRDEGPENHKLSTLAQYFNLEFTHHIALEDANVTLKVFCELLAVLKQNPANYGPLKDVAFLFKLKSFEKNKEMFLPNKIKDLKEYIQQQKPIDMIYKGGSKPNRYRPIRPLSLLNLPQGLVLYALCLQSNINKYYKVKKIQGFKDYEVKDDKTHTT